MTNICSKFEYALKFPYNFKNDNKLNLFNWQVQRLLFSYANLFSAKWPLYNVHGAHKPLTHTHTLPHNCIEGIQSTAH